MSNMRVKNLLILFTLLVLAACSDKEEPLEELFLSWMQAQKMLITVIVSR